MSEALRILSVGAGTLLAIVVFAVIVFWFIEDVTQKKHAVLRNYPVIGRLRYFFEKQGEYFRQYFFAGGLRPRRLAERGAHVVVMAHESTLPRSGDRNRSARASSSSRSRTFFASAAARSHSRAASSKRPSLASRSPRTLGSRW